MLYQNHIRYFAVCPSNRDNVNSLRKRCYRDWIKVGHGGQGQVDKVGHRNLEEDAENAVANRRRTRETVENRIARSPDHWIAGSSDQQIN